MKKTFPIMVTVGGRSKRVVESAKRIHHARGPIFGLSEYVGPKRGKATGCRVWIYSRQKPRALADTFFHEMAHVFLRMLGGGRKQGRREENLCDWIGWLAKGMLADYDDKKYGRRA